VISFDGFSFWYPDAERPTLRDVDLAIADGEFALLVGATGAGKSTLLRAVNGLVPSFTGGHVEGRVVAAGHDTRTTPPREFASSVGVVGQDPLTGFVTDTVEEELAYAMEQLSTPPPVMRRRVEEVLDLMGIAPLRRRSLRSLSGGEQQRVAIGSVLTAMPSILVLDEPTSALDPVAAEDALAAVLRLVHDVGITVLAAEHRLERVVEYADRLVVVDAGGVRSGPPQVELQSSPLAPPVVELGRLARWSPLPLSVRDARRSAAG
jgi:energy-coupling factor transport system ATP-binding protein